jgi:hypothetical protein
VAADSYNRSITTMLYLANRTFIRKSEAELRYIIKDAGEAARNMRGFDPVAEGKYLDQVNDAVSVLHSRKKLSTVN